MFRTILLVHIALGCIGLALGPVVLFSRKTKGIHTNLGEIYHAVMFGICATAIALALLDWNHLWPFLYIGAGSYAFALVGYLAGKLRRRHWLKVHLIGQCGSYIAIITAVTVVNWGSVWAWILPTVVGTPIVTWLVREVVLGRRPKV